MTDNDKTKLIQLERYLEEALTDPSWKDFRKNAVKCFQYKEGDQWTAAELAELDKRGQPPIVNNQVRVTIDRLVGQFVKLKSRIAFKPRNTQDQQTADILSDLLLYIHQNNALEFVERDVAEDGFTCGFGVFETYADFDDELQPDIRIDHVDSLSIHPDPKSSHYDWNRDALYILRSKWVDLDEAKKLYPHVAAQLGSMMSSDSLAGGLAAVDSLKKDNFLFTDPNRNMVRLVEAQYKEKESETLLVFSDDRAPVLREDISKKELKVVKDSGVAIEELTRVKITMRNAVFTAGLLLEDKESRRKNFSFVPYFVQRKKSREPYSLVLTSLSMQDAINKRESKALHLLTANQSIYEEGAILDPVKHSVEKAKPDGNMEIQRGFFDKFELQNNRELAATQMQFATMNKADFRHITGVNPDALGEKSEVRSGVGIARKVAMTDLILAGLFDNFRRTRKLLANNIVELVRLYYTEAKIFTITDSQNAPKQVELDEKSLAAIKQNKYDIVIDEIPDFINNQEQQFSELTQALPQLLPFGGFWLEFLLEISTIKNKADIIEKIRNAPKPPSALPKISVSANLEELSPVERAFFYTQMGSPEVAQAVLQGQAPTGEQSKQETEQIKAKGAMVKVQGDIAKTQAKLKADMAKASVQLQSEVVKSQLDMQGKQLDIVEKQLDIRKKMLEVEQAGNEDE